MWDVAFTVVGLALAGTTVVVASLRFVDRLDSLRPIARKRAVLERRRAEVAARRFGEHQRDELHETRAEINRLDAQLLALEDTTDELETENLTRTAFASSKRPSE